MKIQGNNQIKTEMKKSLLFTILLSLGIVLGLNAQIPTDGLVASYPFNGNANDESGNGLNGTVVDAIPSVDRFGNPNSAYSFDGNSGTERYIYSNIGQNNTITFCVWFKAPNPTTYYPMIFNYGTSNNVLIQLLGNNPSYINGGHIGKVSAGSVINDGPGWAVSLFSDKRYDDNNWHFMVVSFVPNDKLYLYIDNQLVNTAAYTANYPTDDLLYIGRQINDNSGGTLHGSHFNGSIDDIRIYNRALDSVEINSLYQEGGWSSLDQGLAAHYPFNGNANDASGNGNDGTVNGATLTADRFGNANSAYSFDGASDYIQCVSNITNIDTITISGWAKSNSPLGGHFVHIGEDDNSFCNGIGVGKGGTDIMGLNTWNEYNGNNLLSLLSCVSYYDSGYLLDSISWFNFAIIKTNDTISYYVNGTFVGSSPVSNANNPVNKIFLGTSGLLPGAKTFYNGNLDDIRIYNRAVTESEILSLYQERFCFETIYDTIQVFDTTFVTVHDTITTEVYDTVLISVTDTLIIDVVLTDVNPPDNYNTLKIYPNPAKDRIFINTGDYTKMDGYQLKIVNQTGSVVFETNVEETLYEVNLSTWTGIGLYFVQVIDSGGSIIDVRKIILE